MSKYAYIESSTGIVWAASTAELDVVDVAADTGFPVDVRRSDAPDGVEPKGSGLDRYHKWNSPGYSLEWDLDKVKAAKRDAIDLRTQEIIAEGITYDGRQFPLDLPDQSTWHALFNAVAAGQASYPIKVMDQDDDPYYLADATAFQTMYFSGFGAVNAILEGGRTLKASVNACTTKAEVDAIVDDR